MTDAPMTTENFDIGRVISRTFGVIKGNFPVFFGLSVLLSGVPAAVIGLVTASLVGSDVMVGGQPAMDQLGVVIGMGVIGGLVAIAFAAVLQGSLVHAAVTDLRGGTTTLGASLAVGLRFLLPLVAVSLLYALGLGIGLVLFVIPGIIVAVLWAVVAPAVVVDRAGVIGSFSRSAELTKGRRWSIFGLFVIYVIFAIVLGLVMELPGQAVALSSQAGFFVYILVLSPLQSVVASMIGAAGVAALYVELRQLKEGVGVDAIASVFE